MGDPDGCERFAFGAEGTTSADLPAEPLDTDADGCLQVPDSLSVELDEKVLEALWEDGVGSDGSAVRVRVE